MHESKKQAEKALMQLHSRISNRDGAPTADNPFIAEPNVEAGATADGRPFAAMQLAVQQQPTGMVAGVPDASQPASRAMSGSLATTGGWYPVTLRRHARTTTLPQQYTSACGTLRACLCDAGNRATTMSCFAVWPQVTWCGG